MKFYKRDPDRALAGMAELNFKQRGAYNSLIDLLYSRDGNVPDDDTRVARMLSCHWREWATLKKQLMALGKVWTEEGKLRARRVQDTLKEAASFSQKQSRNASQRWHKPEKVNKNNDPRMPRGNALTPTPTPTVSKKDSPSIISPRKFDLFWQAYPTPRRGGKDKARVEFEKQVKLGADPDFLIGAATEYGTSKEVGDGYVVHVFRWIRDKRFDDEQGGLLLNGRSGSNGSGAAGATAAFLEAGAEFAASLDNQRNQGGNDCPGQVVGPDDQPADEDGRLQTDLLRLPRGPDAG